MSRCVRHLLGSTWCQWQLMTSPLRSANQQLPSIAHQWCLTVPGIIRGDSSRPSVRVFHGAGRLCYDTNSSAGAEVDGGDRPAIEETSISDGPEGTPSTHHGHDLKDLDLGKTYIPPVSTENLMFGGIPYYELPVIHIKATYNNTHVNITDHTGRRSYTRTTCGAEGFKKSKKGTTVAAQTVGIAAATKALEKGLKTVRVVVKGIGPGRQASIKGLQMGGVDIVSITDNTPIPHNGNRPRKARRL